MAPHKQPISLLQLAHNEVGKLVLNTCIDIDVIYKYNDPSWQEEVDSLQAVLVDHIPAYEWDNMCDVVFRAASSVNMIDSRVIYATLVHKNMKKLVVEPLCELTKGCRFYAYDESGGARPIRPFTEEDNGHRDFWLQLIAKLVNVVDMNMMLIDCYEIYAAIGENCKKLERLSYGMVSYVAVLKNCMKLRYLKYFPFRYSLDDQLMTVQGKYALEMFPDLEEFDYLNMAEILKTVVVSRPLNLRCYRQHSSTPREISRMVMLCPNLISLDIQPVSAKAAAEIFKTLAASSLQLTHLDIDMFYWENNIENFLKRKGNFIEYLSISSMNPDMHATVLSIALYCKNLNSLQVIDCQKYEEHQTKISTKDVAVFKCLNYFAYFGFSWAIPEFCLLHSSSVLTSLKIDFMSTFDDNMFAAFREHRLTEMVRIDFTGVVTPALLRHVYHSCTKLTHLKLMGKADSETMDCVKYLESQVKDNNLDLHIDARYLDIIEPMVDLMGGVHLSDNEDDD